MKLKLILLLLLENIDDIIVFVVDVRPVKEFVEDGLNKDPEK